MIELIKLAYEFSGTKIPYDNFSCALKSCELYPLEKHGEIIGIVTVKGPEIHATVSKDCRGKWFSRRFVREYLSPLIKKYGYCLTQTIIGDYFGHCFVTKAGFEISHLTDKTAVYRMEGHKWL